MGKNETPITSTKGEQYTPQEWGFTSNGLYFYPQDHSSAGLERLRSPIHFNISEVSV